MEFWQVIGKYIADSWDMLIGRSGGPFALRFIMQPVMAMILGIRAGRKDARQNKPLYFWSIFEAGDKYDRRAILRDGWGDMSKAFSIAIGLDVVYELVAFRWVYPIQALIIATVLALIPYLIFRGIANRIASKRQKTT